MSNNSWRKVGVTFVEMTRFLVTSNFNSNILNISVLSLIFVIKTRSIFSGFHDAIEKGNRTRHVF